MYIEIITTPNEALKESGFGCLKACNSVLEAIKEMGHNVRLNVCETKKDLLDVVSRSPELVVLAVKYIVIQDQDDIWLSEYFAQHNINFTGSTREVLKYDSNKVRAKIHLTSKGIKTAEYFIATPGQFKNHHELPVSFPLFLKPLDAANGNGIDDLSFVTNFADFESKVASLYSTYHQPILAEEYLGGSEFTVAVIKTNDEKLIVSAVEVIPPTSSNGLKILGSRTKKDDSETLLKIEDDAVRTSVTKLAIEAFTALHVRDYGRIDIKSNEEGECFFMEANLVPGMTYGSSYFPHSCELAHELPYSKVVELLLDAGLARASSTVPPNIISGPDNSLQTAI